MQVLIKKEDDTSRANDAARSFSASSLGHLNVIFSSTAYLLRGEKVEGTKKTALCRFNELLLGLVAVQKREQFRQG